ncbi:MAG: hypothetical protein M1835_005732, partial [Candelina submexicana]
ILGDNVAEFWRIGGRKVTRQRVFPSTASQELVDRVGGIKKSKAEEQAENSRKQQEVHDKLRKEGTLSGPSTSVAGPVSDFSSTISVVAKSLFVPYFSNQGDDADETDREHVVKKFRARNGVA